MDIKKQIQQAIEIYQNKIYGQWRTGEEVTYEVLEKSKRIVCEDPEHPFATMFQLSTTDEGTDVEIKVALKEKSGCFTVRVYAPDKKTVGTVPDGFPYIVCMHPIQPKQYALDHGYGLVFLDTSMVAEDNHLRKGLFYDLYPYEEDPMQQTGELMAWAWAASKVLDAMENGLAKELGFCAKNAMVTGVSRWGKATAVCGAFEPRFRMTVPVCSGAGGLALWGYQSEGKEYDLSMCGGPKDYIYGQNEPLSCLQSEAERGWFIDEFLKFDTYTDIPVEQYMLPVLAADANRRYLIVAAWMGEDWVNAPSMYRCYLKAKELFECLGLGDTIQSAFHKEGHAVLEEDMEKIIRIFDEMISQK